MRYFLTIILVLIVIEGKSQGVNLRAGYAYGPENGFILMPPIKVSAEYVFSSKPSTFYTGMAMGGNMMMEFWGGIGIYAGYKMKNFFVENEYNWFLDLGDSYYGVPSTSQFSINPKVGFEKYHLYVKTGPSIELNSRTNSNRMSLNYLHVGNITLNLEVGYHYFLDFNEIF